MKLQTILGWLALAFVVWWVIKQPAGAAHVVHQIGMFLNSAAHGLSNFFASAGGPSSKGKDDWIFPVVVFGSIALAIVALFVTVAVLEKRRATAASRPKDGTKSTSTGGKRSNSKN